MPAHRFEGKCGISIDARKILLPSQEDPRDFIWLVFERPMQACLDLSYHPEEFKEAALEFIIDAIYRNGSVKSIYFTVAALDMTGAFNHVVHYHLLCLFVEYGVPIWMIQFIWEFLSRRSTTVRLHGKLSKKFWIKIGVPQGSPLSPIFFVFFTIPILRRLRESRTLESRADMTIFQLFDLVITGYVDDITILLASSSYELNCEALAQVYRRLTRFTSLHGTEFSADKTQVIHLCQPCKAPPIVNVMPNVSGFPTEAKDDAIKVLGLHLDYQLKWNVHIAHTLAKVRQKMYQMRRVCGSTWVPDVLKLRHQYITSVRPILAYACALWYVVRRTKGTRCKWSLCQALVNKLETEQT
ncbi:putative RNA-directed DNA polymerase from transposon BS [Colletotrichum siamense]|nr:putative RNA-directed DNA polymerase from transposon BS [Colletotrichum siamense]